jgi:uncharacterized protein (DUF2147 family)
MALPHPIRPIARNGPMTVASPALRRVVLVLGMLSATAGLARAAPDPMGDWARDDGSTRIQIAPCGADLCAVNTWVRDPEGREKVGDVLEMMVAPESGSALKGKAHDRRRDMTFSVTLSFDGDGMRSRGCVLFGLLCKSADWHRVP